VFDVAVTYLLRERAGIQEVLLGEKLTGIGMGKIVAPGGKSESGENPAHTAVREIREEVGLRVDSRALTPIAEITYPFHSRPELSQRSFAFLARDFAGELQASSELDASWWPVGEIPLERMWSDAKLWLPRALTGEYVRATIEIGLENEVRSAEFF
jgi:8-oxo-dGTP pyrophosphatase MutT (NUDIX family)